MTVQHENVTWISVEIFKNQEMFGDEILEGNQVSGHLQLDFVAPVRLLIFCLTSFPFFVGGNHHPVLA